MLKGDLSRLRGPLGVAFKGSKRVEKELQGFRVFVRRFTSSKVSTSVYRDVQGFREFKGSLQVSIGNNRIYKVQGFL